MEIEREILRMSTLQSYILDYIDGDNDKDNLQTLIQFLKEEDDIECPIRDINQIIKYHHRTPNFFNKITTIMDLFKHDKQEEYLVMRNFFINNYLVKNKLIQIDKLKHLYTSPVVTYEDKDLTNPHYLVLLYNIFKSINEEDKQKEIESASMKIFNIDFQKLENLCQIGENDSEICTIIRSDSINDFIRYYNEKEIDLDMTIPFSTFETNELLKNFLPKLIEYAAFFGSIQIFKFLLKNQVRLTSSLLCYAVHGRNPEIIHIIEENLKDLPPNKNVYEMGPFYFSSFFRRTNDFNFLNNQIKIDPPINAMLASIQCLHNDIARYFEENYYDGNDERIKIAIENVANFNINYEFMPNDFSFGNHFIPSSCFKFEKITLPSSETKLTGKNLNDFTNLKEIIIPSSIISIGAFNGCKSLVQVSFSTPSSLEFIDEFTFAGCSSLCLISIPSSVHSFGKSAFANCSSLEQIEIPFSVTSIGNYCFEGCTSLKHVSISSALTSIGQNVFANCTSLKEISIPSSIKVIDNKAFINCSSLEDVKFSVPSSLESIGCLSFSGCSSIKQIEIPFSVTTIGKSSFSDCLSLKQIVIPSSVTLIDDFTFDGCSSLEQIIIPSSVTIIGAYSFNNCSSITQVTIPTSVTMIKNGAFKGCSSLVQIEIPSSINLIGNEVFKECSALTHISIPSSISKISDFSFYKCTSLKQIRVPSSLTEVGSFSFYGCSSLTSIESLENLKRIGDSAFDGCPLLTIKLPKILVNDQSDKDDIQRYITNWKEFYKDLLCNFKSSSDVSINDQLMKKIQKMIENESELVELLNLLSRISRYPNPHYINFFDKVETILNICKEKMKQTLSNSKIIKIFNNNRRVIFILLENKTLEFTQSLYNNIINNERKHKYKEYFKPEIIKLKYQSEETRNQHLSKLPKDFISKRKTGQNDDEIYQLIRKDLLDEFIQYIAKMKKENKNFNYDIYTIFEINPILEINPIFNYLFNFIQYAAFYGATKIFNYLLRIKFPNENELFYSSLWKYATYGNQLDIIHILEKNGILFEKKRENNAICIAYQEIIDAEYCVNSAIKCHNNEIAQYIINTYNISSDLFQPALESSNYAYIDTKSIEDGELLYKLCLYDYPKLAQILIDTKRIDVDSLPNKNDIIKASIKADNSIFMNLFKKLTNIQFTTESLIDAILNDNIEIFKIILSHSNNNASIINKKQEVKFNNMTLIITPFQLAIITQNVEMIELLLNTKIIDVNECLDYFKTIERPTALHVAIFYRNIPIVKLLLSQPNIDVNCYAYFSKVATYKMKDIIYHGFNGHDYVDLYCTPLHEAIEYDNIEIMKLLLAHPNIRVNRFEVFDSYHRKDESFDRVKRTALCRAIQKKNIEMVKLLLEHHDIDVNIESFYHQNFNVDGYFLNQNDEEEEHCNEEEEDNYIDIDVNNLSDDTDEDNVEDNIDNNNQKVDDILNIDCLFYHDVDIKNINAKRTILQFAYANKSRDIIQLLLNRKDIKNTRAKKNDFLIERFYKY